MCEPSTITLAIGAGVAALSAGAGLYQQSEQASTNREYQENLAVARNREIEDNYNLSFANYRLQQDQLNRRVSEEGEKLAGEESKNAIAAAQARATARVAAGEAGVAGLSVDALLRDFKAQELRYRDGLRRNNEILAGNIEDQKEASAITARGRVSSVQPISPSPIAMPNYLGEVFKLGSTLYNQYTQYNRQQPRR
jgi:hypothetical protein